MDIIKGKQIDSSFHKYLGGKILFSIACLMIVIPWLISRNLSDAAEVSREALVLGEVQRGGFEVVVRGYGTLKSNNQKLLTSLNKATVEEIVLQPGAIVERGSVILRLSNPLLKQELGVAWQQLESEKAQLQQIELSHQREMQDEEINLIQLQSDLELALLRKDAQKELLEKGIVSQLDYAESRLRASQLERNIQVFQQKMTTLKKVNEKSLEIQKKFIAQKDVNYQAILEKQEGLTVRAEDTGIVQDLFVELGQSVEAGEKLVLVGGQQDLLAVVKIPQAKVDMVAMDQEASIHLSDTVVPAIVKRIDPAVVDGTVTVELQPTQLLPSAARPNQRIDASVSVSRIDQALFVKRPANARPNSSMEIFKITSDSDVAEKYTVRFGKESGQFIQIENGANANEKLILNELPNLGNQRMIKIAN